MLDKLDKRYVENLQQLNGQTLSQKYIFSKTIMMYNYKVLNSLAPDYLKEKFSYVCQRHKHILRNTDVNLLLPEPNTEYR